MRNVVEFKNEAGVVVEDWGPLIVNRGGKEVRVETESELRPGDLLEVVAVHREIE